MGLARGRVVKPEENMTTFFSCRVAGCQLSPEDCKLLASVLTNSKTLDHLNIASNSLDKGVSSLCKALCHPDSVLKYLV